MIFVALGSQKFQFNRLLIQIDKLIESGLIKDQVIAQIGYSDYIPKNFIGKQFVDHEEFERLIKDCRLLITHAGTGTIMAGLKNGKKVIAVPRSASYKEHVDDHQQQILKEFDEMSLIYSCYDVENLGEAIQQIDSMIFNTYESKTQDIIDSIICYINNLGITN